MTTATTQHTPGPWKVIQHNHAEGDLWLSVNGAGTEPGWVAEIKYLTTDEEKQWANARLIAAAPVLLEQLKRLVYFHRTNDTPNSDPWEDARAAIAKAEGK